MLLHNRIPTDPTFEKVPLCLATRVFGMPVTLIWTQRLRLGQLNQHYINKGSVLVATTAIVDIGCTVNKCPGSTHARHNLGAGTRPMLCAPCSSSSPDSHSSEPGTGAATRSGRRIRLSGCAIHVLGDSANPGYYITLLLYQLM